MISEEEEKITEENVMRLERKVHTSSSVYALMRIHAISITSAASLDTHTPCSSQVVQT